MDVFVSYAHEDAAFAERLRQAISARGREVWVDTEGIQPADRWRSAAQRAIERADALVFVLSVASVGSRACLEELNYAVSLNKRLIAVCVAEEVADIEKPAALDELSWIMMRPQDEFDQGIEQILHALDTDFELVHAHTDILVRARAWELANRRSSPLLRGEELRTAEGWLLQASVGAGPEPTQLQREFIAASRHATTRRQAAIAGISSVVALAAVALAVFALIQRSQAINNQKIAQSRLLSSEAESTLPSDGSLSTLLALRALRIHHTSQAEHALRDALANLQTLLVLKGHTDGVNNATFDRNGSRIVTAGADGTARVWNARTGAQQLVLRVPPGPNSPIFDAAFSPDGSRIITSDFNRAILWDARTGRQVRVLQHDTRAVLGVAFSPDGSRVLTAGLDAQVWDARSGRQLVAIRGPGRGVAGSVQAAFSPDGSRIVVVFPNGLVQLWSARTGRALLRLQGRLAPAFLSVPSFSPDGARILVAGRPTAVWDARTGRRLVTLTDPSTETSDESQAAFSPDGNRVVTGNGIGLTMFDVKTGTPLATIKDPTQGITSVAFSPDGGRLVTAESDHTARVWEAQSQTEQLVKHGVNDNNFAGADLSPDGSDMIAVGNSSKAWSWDARTGRLLGTLNEPNSTLRSASFSPDQTRIVTTDGLAAEVWDAPNHVRLFRFDATGGPQSAVYSSNGAVIITVDFDGRARLWDASTGRQVATLPVRHGKSDGLAGVTSAALSSDGRYAALGVLDGTAHVYSVQTGRPLHVLRGHAGAVNSVAYSPDGSRIVTASDDQTARVWDGHTGRQILTLRGHTAKVGSAAFSPNGSLIATGSDDQTVRIWDARTGVQLLVLNAGTGPVETVDFSRNGKHILAATESDLIIWSTRLAQPISTLERLAHQLVPRAFTPQERRTYLAGIT
jgi:WD40 repeat protein